MSSKYQAERLTGAVIKSILEVLRRRRALSYKLYLAVERDLSKSNRDSLHRKGGESEYYRITSYLKRKHYINKVGRGKDAAVEITKVGRNHLDYMNFAALSLTAAKWDKKWRVVTFDIPEDRRAARDALRRLLKELGFQQLHKSVWVHPLPCREQIQVIQKRYGVQEHITLLEVTGFDQAAKFERLFAKKLINS